MKRLTMLLCALLAGCSADPGGPDDARPDAAGPEVIEAPQWQVGDWWRYNLGGAIITWVVTEDLGSDWQLDVDDPEFRWDHDAFAQVSTVDRVSKAHLAGSQEAGPVEFFRFPLTENKTWDLVWDGIAFAAKVMDVVDGTAEVHAVADDGTTRVYIYDNATRWFRMVASYDANGTEQFRVDIAETGRDYSGVYYRWGLHEEVIVDVGVGQSDVRPFDVPAEATDLWYFYHIICSPDGIEGDQGAYVFEVHPSDPNAQGISATKTCPTHSVAAGSVAPSPGEWGLTVASMGGSIDARLVPRTLHELRLP